MPIKDWLYRLHRAKLCIILTLSTCYLIAQLILSHISHALTLQFSAYHMLCNIIYLIIMISTKVNEKTPTSLSPPNKHELSLNTNQNGEKPKNEENNLMKLSKIIPLSQSERHRHQNKIRNTFGWTRIHDLTMSIVFIFLASLSFSHIIEVIKIFVHIDHKDAAHYPIPILVTGIFGLFLNILCYLLIGGYSVHQRCLHARPNSQSSLEIRESDTEIVLCIHSLIKQNKISGNSSLNAIINAPKKSAAKAFLKDISSCMFVILCATTVYYANYEDVEKFIDPIISLISCSVLIAFNYPHMKESCLILLQNIPVTIDIENFKKNLHQRFSEIISIHDLHIWTLSSCNYISTVHIVFQDFQSYKIIKDDVKKFFHEQGIMKVTIQPEFQTERNLNCECLITNSCRNLACYEKSCCPSIQSKLNEIITSPNDCKFSQQLDVIDVLSLESNNIKSFKYLDNSIICKEKCSSESKINSNDSNEPINLDRNPNLKQSEPKLRTHEEHL